MSSVYESQGLHVEWLSGASQQREQRERELLARGLTLPLRGRTAWVRAHPDLKSTLLVATDAQGAAGAIVVEKHASRALPFHSIWRVPRAGAALTDATTVPVISALVAAVRHDWRVLRVHFEVFSRYEASREQLGRALSAAGFRAAESTMSYEYTLVTDLRGVDANALFATLGRRVRQNITAVSQFPIEMRSVVDASDSDQMNALLGVTLSRTGAAYRAEDYSRLIRLTVEEPSLAQLVGLYRTDVSGPEALVAFALGVVNGDYVSYDMGASGRIPALRGLSMGYPLLWRLIEWAHGQGATWFDYGGVTAGTSDSDDPLGRISDFKRRFSKETIRVADEWVLSPRPMRDRMAKLLSRASELARGWRNRDRGGADSSNGKG